MAFNMKPFDNSFFDANLVIYSETLDVNFRSISGSNSIKTDVKELEDAYVVEAELPGMKKKILIFNLKIMF